MRYSIDSDRVVHETVDDEVILIQLESGNYYSLRGTGAEVWGLLADGATASQILGRLRTRYQATPEMAESVESLLEELASEHLATREPDPGEATPPEAESTGTEPFSAPRLEKYTDMRDYLLVDPLHDVDERGWPAPAPE